MFINDTDLFTRFVDTFLFLFIDGKLPYKWCREDEKQNKKPKKLVLQILLYFQEKGVSIETVLNFACNLPC